MAAAAITAPVITQTSTAGANPFTFSVAENAAYFPGYYWNAQSSAVSNFASTLSDVVQQIEPGDLSGTDDIILTGFTTPSSGAMYTRLRVGIEDGSGGYTWGSWSNTLSDTIVAQAAAFSFTDITNATQSTQYTSNTITISGLGGASNAYSVSGGTVSKNGGAFSGTSGTVVDGDTLAVRVTSSASLSTAVNCTLTVGTFSDTYTVTTVASASVWTYNAAPAYQSLAFGSTTATFTNEAFLVGTGIVAVGSSDRTVSAVTVGGNAATLVVNSGSGDHAVSLWRVAIGTAGNYTVVVTNNFGGTFKDIGIATGTLAASLNATPTATVAVNNNFLADPQTTPSITIPTGGVAIAIVGAVGSGSAPSWVAGTANTERHSAVNGDISFGTASYTTAGAFQFQVNNYNFAGAGICAAAWGP